MFRDLLEIVQEGLKKIITSRVFALAVMITFMFAMLIGKLFNLQIVHGEEALNQYISKTMKTVYTPGTRGNILDRNGNILAYNELAYSVIIQDVGAYPKNAAKNHMLLQLVRILDKHHESVEGKLEITIDQNGDMVYTTSSEIGRKRFLRDYYGLVSVELLDDAKGKYPSAVTAREIFEQKKKYYELDKLKDEKNNPLILTDEEALNIINIRYTMSLTAYQKYENTTVASYVSDETVADISEHMAELQGVGIAESTIRIYNDSVYFAPIIGYTGKVQSDQLEELKKSNENYELSDIVGRIGIESSMEYALQGHKGIKNMYVDNMGRVLKVEDDVTEPVAGNNVYLTIDRDLQIGIYNLIEQQLAGILTSSLVPRDVTDEENQDSSKKKIPIKDAYYQLINNNVLSLKSMESEEASDIEKDIHRKLLSSREQILADIRTQLENPTPTPMAALPEDMKAYMNYIYSYLSDPTIGIIQKEKIEVTDPDALAWKAETISLREFIYAGISKSWIDTTKLEIKSKYSNADDSFTALVQEILAQLAEDTKFTKKIYRYLINQDVITGRELCLALYAQGVLPYEEDQVALLTSNGVNYAYNFIIDKLSKLEITPAQLALDPCTAGCTVTDVKTGEVRALVTYPSYDNNRLSGIVDSAYYSQLNDDLSLPLYNNATQVLKAPGSTFKPITAIAALEEHALSTTDTVKCTGLYDEVFPKIKCWIYPGYHGDLDVVGGIQNSCNYFFATAAHLLSTDENGVYSTDKGIETIRKYATMFGFDHTSGIEISESQPNLTTEDPERSAMGQGTNAYNNVQLSRYVSALANRGTVFELSLIDKISDSNETLVKDFTPAIANQVEIADSTWDSVQQGMRQVVASGSAKDIFKDLANKLNLKPYSLVKHSIAWSLKQGGSVKDFKSDSNGLDLNRQTI
ncbi:MAG: penicillin-binding transpeptidase domain-containing protein, partial [Hungatella sp.]